MIFLEVATGKWWRDEGVGWMLSPEGKDIGLAVAMRSLTEPGEPRYLVPLAEHQMALYLGRILRASTRDPS